MKNLIEVDRASKKLCRSLKRGIFYGLSDCLKQGVGLPTASHSILRKDEFWALRDISFNVREGETVGLIGSNGSGKTTLLRLINGIYPLSEGKITMRGRVAPLIGIGAAFHAHLSGRENIALNASLLGMSRHDLRKTLDSIVDFAEVSQSLSAPLASYSSGMIVRLGFAIAVHCNVDIILADEILAVGDVAFQAKCLRKISELRKQGVSTILVSHDTERILAHSTRVILINKGRLEYDGDTIQGVSKYKELSPDVVENKQGKVVVSGIDGVDVKDLKTISDTTEGDIVYPSKDGSLKISFTANNSHSSRMAYIRISFRASKFCAEPIFVSDVVSDQVKIELKQGRNNIECTLQNLNFLNVELSIDLQLKCAQSDEVLFWASQIPLSTKRSDTPAGFLKYPVSFEVKPE